MRLCIVGGGGFRTPNVWQALLRDTAERRVTEVVLHDTDPQRLRVVEAVLHDLAADVPGAPTLRATTDLVDAVAGSDFVFAAVRVGGLDGRCHDEHVALDRGVLGQETTGPGGVAYAIRTVPVMLRLAEVVRAHAPTAYLLNFTNPAGTITEACQAVLGDRALGICDTPIGLGRGVAAALGRDRRAVDLDYVGLNHLGWMRRVLLDGTDLLPELLADDTALARLEETALFGAEWLRLMGWLPNEYLYYFYRNHEAVAAIRAAAQTRGDYLRTTQTAFYAGALTDPAGPAAAWRRALADRDATYLADVRGGAEREEQPADLADLGYAGVALAVMAAIARDEPARLILNVRNGSTVSGLPADAVVEVSCAVDAEGVHPLPLATQPDLHQLGLMQQVKAVERHAIAAATTGDPGEALKALALHPLVGSWSTARDLLDGYTATIPELAAVLSG